MTREFNNLEQLVNAVNALEKASNFSRDDAASHVVDIARKYKDLLEQKVGELESVLANANPTYSTPLFVACIRVIWDVSTMKKEVGGWNKAIELLKTLLTTGICVREHVRMIPEIYLPLARECVLYTLTKKNNPFDAYDLGKVAVESYMLEGENCLTSLHSATLAAAIKIGDFNEARKYVYTPIRDIISELPPNAENFDVTSKRSRCGAPPFFDPKFLLSYLFYCGLVTAKQGDYKLAVQFMEMCISVPGSVASQVQLDAFKKYYVLSLIVYGTVTIPVNRCPSLMRVMKAKGRLDAYTMLVEAVTAKDDKTRAVINALETKRIHFEQDKNWGLCQILLKTLKKKAVLSVAKVYSSVRLDALAARSFCDENEIIPFLRDLEEQGELIADIDIAANTVRLTLKQATITKEDLQEKAEYVDYIRKEIERLDIAAQKNPSHIVRTLRGVMATLALMDDEGLSEAAFPMDT